MVSWVNGEQGHLDKRSGPCEMMKYEDMCMAKPYKETRLVLRTNSETQLILSL